MLCRNRAAGESRVDLATDEDIEEYLAVNNPPEPPINPGYWPGSTYNTVVGALAEEETWKRYPPNRSLQKQQPYDGIIATKNGKDTGFAEDMRQVQVKTRTWEKKSGGNNYYNITLPTHDRMASDGFYHFWVHTVDAAPDTVSEDTTYQTDLMMQPVTDDAGADEDTGGVLRFHGDTVLTWEEVDALISYAEERDVTGVGVSTDSYDNPRVDIAVPLIFDYKDALETAKAVYCDEEHAVTDALRRIDDSVEQELERITFYG